MTFTLTYLQVPVYQIVLDSTMLQYNISLCMLVRLKLKQCMSNKTRLWHIVLQTTSANYMTNRIVSFAGKHDCDKLTIIDYHRAPAI